jgi:hypothetical protein
MRISNHRGATLQSCTLAIALLVLITGGLSCGDESPVEPVSGNDPASSGEGTGTLHVVVDVQGRSANVGAPQTQFVATITDELGAPVSGTVIVSGRFGDLRLTEDTPGSYSALRAGYETGSYTLNVTSGPDNVTGVTVQAPDIHTITTPTANEVVEANTALNVRWTPRDAAAECRLETRDFNSDWIYGDPGVLWTPTIGNPPRSDQRVRVTRRNFQIPQGALAGSRFSVGYRYTVEPVIAE